LKFFINPIFYRPRRAKNKHRIPTCTISGVIEPVKLGFLFEGFPPQSFQAPCDPKNNHGEASILRSGHTQSQFPATAALILENPTILRGEGHPASCPGPFHISPLPSWPSSPLPHPCTSCFVNASCERLVAIGFACDVCPPLLAVRKHSSQSVQHLPSPFLASPHLSPIHVPAAS
jgi:hypothetical protein